MNKVILICDKCLANNYSTNKSSTKRMKINKFCKHCKEHTLHKENK